MAGRVKFGLLLLAAAALAVALTAREPQGQAADLDDGCEALAARDYSRARVLFTEAAADGKNAAHAYLAQIAFFYGEWEEARRELAEVREPDEVDRMFLAALDSPFAAPWGEGAAALEGKSPGGHYYLLTDLEASEEEVARLRPGKKTKGHRRVGALLEAVHKAYGSVFRLRRDRRLVSRVVLFADRGHFERWSKRTFGEDMSDAVAFYEANTHTLVASATLEGRADALDAATQSALLHEAFHQFVHFYVDDAPYWFDEGCAEYFGASEFVPGEEKMRVGRTASPDPESPSNLETIQKALRRGRYAPLPRLLTMEGEAFMAESTLHYAESWSVVHFLAHGTPGGGALLGKYFRALIEGADGEEAYAQVFGALDMDRLEAAWREYVLALE